jgi:H+/Cl- antiporter ClcA
MTSDQAKTEQTLAEQPEKTGRLTLVILTITIGITSGLAGMALSLLLHLVQHVAYGYSLDKIIGGESFLLGVTAASYARRVLVLCVCGAVAGVGWWLLYRIGRPLVPISQAVQRDGPRMPFLSTCAHTILQMLTVGLGSPLGREVAPRELSAVVATELCERIGLTPERTRVMIACAAGAGLAAVYNVPLGGALFTLEGLLGTFEIQALLPALATSVIATTVAWIGLGNEPQYSIPSLGISTSLIVWSAFMGPLFGLGAYIFRRATAAAQARAPKDWRLLPWCAVVFPVIGILACRYPQLLGNGKGIAQCGFDGSLAVPLAAALLLLRFVVILGALRAGASGGLLTPGLSIGGLMGILLGSAWTHVWPAGSLAGFATIGSGAFLASSMKMPITAIVLMLELTHIDNNFLAPLSIAAAGSFAVLHLCSHCANLLASRRANVRAQAASLRPQVD